MDYDVTHFFQIIKKLLLKESDESPALYTSVVVIVYLGGVVASAFVTVIGMEHQVFVLIL